MPTKQSISIRRTLKKKKLANKRKAAPLARAFWPIYKQAQAEVMLADAGQEERELLYFILAAKERTAYKGFENRARTLDRLNKLSTYYGQGKIFYIGGYGPAAKRSHCIKCRIDHAPLFKITRRQLSTARYNPASYKNQQIL